MVVSLFITFSNCTMRDCIKSKLTSFGTNLAIKCGCFGDRIVLINLLNALLVFCTSSFHRPVILIFYLAFQHIYIFYLALKAFVFESLLILKFSFSYIFLYQKNMGILWVALIREIKQCRLKKMFYIVLLKIPLAQEQSQPGNGTTKLSSLIKVVNIIGVKMTKNYLFTCPRRRKVLIYENISE